MHLIGVALVPIGLGLATDATARWLSIDVGTSLSHARRLTPEWLQIICIVALVVLAIRPLRRLVLGR